MGGFSWLVRRPAAASGPTHALFAAQSHSIVDNLVALLRYRRAFASEFRASSPDQSVHSRFLVSSGHAFMAPVLLNVTPKPTCWVEENIDETLTFYRLPRQHHKHLKSTNMLERLNEESKRRTHVVRSSPMARVVCDWSGRWRSKPTRTGSSSIAISTWTICANTRRRRCAVPPDPRPVQPSTVLAWSRTLRAGSAGAALAAASLTAAARGALPAGRSGRRDGHIRSNKRDVAIDVI